MPPTKNSKTGLFADRVRAHVRSIPAGNVTTYQAVARAVGVPAGARAVARVMAANYDPTVPCHRVVRSDGSVGGYNRGGISAKCALLQSEGVSIVQHTVIIKNQ